MPSPTKLVSLSKKGRQGWRSTHAFSPTRVVHQKPNFFLTLHFILGDVSRFFHKDEVRENGKRSRHGDVEVANLVLQASTSTITPRKIRAPHMSDGRLRGKAPWPLDKPNGNKIKGTKKNDLLASHDLRGMWFNECVQIRGEVALPLACALCIVHKSRQMGENVFHKAFASHVIVGYLRAVRVSKER